MIASFLHNFIFIKTRKTAGTTIELALAPLCGPDDIITPLGGNEEDLRGSGQPLCRNFMPNSDVEKKFVELLAKSDPKSRRRRKKLITRSTFFQHTSALTAKENLPPEFWEGAYKFTVERHPYERVVSKAYFKYRGSNKRSAPFEQFLDKVVRERGYVNIKFYTIDDKIVVNEILRQENLDEDFKRLGERLGLSIPHELPRGKSHHRTDRRPAREILSDEQRQIVYEVCKKEFDILGYEP